MGSCSSVHRNQEPNMKLGLSFGSKTDDIPPSPIKDKPKNGNFLVDDIALKSQWSPSQSTTIFKDYDGSKEEAFFDSKAWLDSDCEDDFFSVNGEFTPSRGTTPVHHTIESPVVNENPSENIIPKSVPGLSPTEKKKNLLELFRESVREDGDHDDAKNTPGNAKEEVKPIIHDPLPKSARNTPYISGASSGCSSERTMDEDHVSAREKSVKSVQCCLPSLASCRSFSERRRKTTSPAIAASEKA